MQKKKDHIEINASVNKSIVIREIKCSVGIISHNGHDTAHMVNHTQYEITEPGIQCCHSEKTDNY